MRGDANLQAFDPPDGTNERGGSESFHHRRWLRDGFGRGTLNHRLFPSANNPLPSGIEPLEVKNRTRNTRGRGTGRRENAAVLQENKNSRVEEIPW
jgi:hypothetical protein